MIIKKTARLPHLFMSIETGTVNSAVPTIMDATGRVDNPSDGASVVPIIPPTKTTKEEQENIKDNPMVSTHTFFGSSHIIPMVKVSQNTGIEYSNELKYLLIRIQLFLLKSQESNILNEF